MFDDFDGENLYVSSFFIMFDGQILVTQRRSLAGSSQPVSTPAEVEVKPMQILPVNEAIKIVRQSQIHQEMNPNDMYIHVYA